MNKKETPAFTSRINIKICPESKRSQEEMLGFALIMVVVAVVLLIFLGFSLSSSKKESVESYEVESFIQSFLQYTSSCEENFELNYLSVQKLILACDKGETCVDGRETCEVLNTTLKEITENSWKIGEEFPVKGYELQIVSSEDSLISFKEGNITGNSKGAVQVLPNSVEVQFTAYY